uniref:Uncharacterized protein n=1 Tax=Utricularia reniformis TaxID=192314 RepID=A0A1Y0B2P9_9LAMI|nr:hypothetical protein AEK19_MT1538 [Utricularia reniformis]ART31725.1 hypothetical protein AEK19_MT1538 [Utricularia reniformis]
MEEIRRTFFWQGSQTQPKKMSSVAWNKILQPYEAGGLNMRGLAIANLSLIWLWWWRPPPIHCGHR